MFKGRKPVKHSEPVADDLSMKTNDVLRVATVVMCTGLALWRCNELRRKRERGPNDAPHVPPATGRRRVIDWEQVPWQRWAKRR
jgi:hypothetical protein